MTPKPRAVLLAQTLSAACIPQHLRRPTGPSSASHTPRTPARGHGPRPRSPGLRRGASWSAAARPSAWAPRFPWRGLGADGSALKAARRPGPTCGLGGGTRVLGLRFAAVTRGPCGPWVWPQEGAGPGNPERPALDPAPENTGAAIRPSQTWSPVPALDAGAGLRRARLTRTARSSRGRAAGTGEGDRTPRGRRVLGPGEGNRPASVPVPACVQGPVEPDRSPSAEPAPEPTGVHTVWDLPPACVPGRRSHVHLLLPPGL